MRLLIIKAAVQGKLINDVYTCSLCTLTSHENVSVKNNSRSYIMVGILDRRLS